MATVMPANALVKLQVICQSDEQIAINVSHWRVQTAGPPDATDQDFADFMDPLASQYYCPILANNAKYIGVVANILTLTPKPARRTANANAANGTGGANENPRQACGIFTLTTAFAGPQYRGRLYLPFSPAADDGTTGGPSSAYLTDANLLAFNFYFTQSVLVAGRSADMVQQIRHRPTNNGTDLEDIITQHKWATQKRRGSYGKPNVSPI